MSKLQCFVTQNEQKLKILHVLFSHALRGITSIVKIHHDLDTRCPFPSPYKITIYKTKILKLSQEMSFLISKI